MVVLLIAVMVMVLGGLAAWAMEARARASSFLGAGSAVAGCLLALVPVLALLGTVPGAPAGALSWSGAWGLPGLTLSFALDGLSAWFLVAVLLLSPVAASYGYEYLLTPSPGHPFRPLGAAWFAFNLLVASLILVLVSSSVLAFLLAWELMSLSSFFLVVFDHEKKEVREAGWAYLVATHLGTALLFVFFLALGSRAGSLEFSRLGAVTGIPSSTAALLFLLAVAGFGTKAGFLPLHVWLPEAHPAAPSHVSALMSGVMIKTGIYGLLRAWTWLAPAAGPVPFWWGWLMVGVGLTSGVIGVLLALAQHDLKRLLAYHSVENIGIIALGLGLGFLGVAAGSPLVAVLGFGGGMLHVLNHALFKGLLFLGAGAVQQATGTRNLEELGGLLKRLPFTGTAFLIGAMAISGLPPWNGFVSEFIIYLGAFQGLMSHAGTGILHSLVVPAVMVIAGLALIGGLAAACFTKACGAVFLGEPRKTLPPARDPGFPMRGAMLILVLGCAAGGVIAPLALRAMIPALGVVSGFSAITVSVCVENVSRPLWGVASVSGLFLAILLVVAWFRRHFLAGKETRSSVTWDCGYAAPSSRMQYTASSFAQPLVDMFRPLLRTAKRRPVITGWFPGEASFSSHTADPWRERWFVPAFSWVAWLLSRWQVLQEGRVQIYVLYLALALAALLAWKLGGG